MRAFIKEALTGGEASIKRIIAFLGFMFLSITMFVNSFSEVNFAPSTDLVNAILYIVIFCIGGNVVEKFLKK